MSSYVATITGTNGSDDIIVSGNGNTSISGGDGHDWIEGGGGDDSISGGRGNDALGGNAGNDNIRGDDGDDDLWGDFGNDTLSGGLGNDSVHGGEGDDHISGGDGDDTLDGGAGHDTISAGQGNDDIWGSAGDDSISGDDGDDEISAGHGNDTVSGGGQNDIIYGGDGNDSIDGGSGRDTIRGEDGHDTLSGGSDHDYITGGRGDDTLYGGDGDDILLGGRGNDTIYGGAQQDTIEGGPGDDRMVAGNLSTHDVFIIRDGHGSDQIDDFDYTEPDIIAFDMAEMSSFSDVQNRLSQWGSDAVITYDNADCLVLVNVDASTLSSANFRFSAAPLCLAADTLIRTPDGPHPIQTLTKGQLIATQDAGPQPLLRLTSERLHFHSPDDPAKPILIRANTFGNAPSTDLITSPQHRIVINGALVPATKLTNRKGIRAMRGRQTALYYNLLFERHHIIFANDLPVESLLRESPDHTPLTPVLPLLRHDPAC